MHDTIDTDVLANLPEVTPRVLWLTVWERADWARRFYLRCGFKEVGVTYFKLGSSDQTDILMAKTV